MNIKAIETHYNGYRFRSRLEARWAVFFDALNIEYRYEPEGFQLPDGNRYLPDFWLPVQQCWIEIKPVEPSAYEEDLAQQLADGTGFDTFIFWGDIGIDNRSSTGHDSAYILFSDGGWDSMHWWCICPDCGVLGIQFQGQADRLHCGHLRNAGRRKVTTNEHPKIMEAYRAARSARFEHGESP